MRIVMCVVGGLLLLSSLGSGAQAQPSPGPRIHKGNDTGGIIAWSCENEALAQDIAADHCARWNKYHRIISVHRQYGDYIAFACLWSPYVNPYALPTARTRASCHRVHVRPASTVLK